VNNEELVEWIRISDSCSYICYTGTFSFITERR